MQRNALIRVSQGPAPLQTYLARALACFKLPTLLVPTVWDQPGAWAAAERACERRSGALRSGIYRPLGRGPDEPGGHAGLHRWCALCSGCGCFGCFANWRRPAEGHLTAGWRCVCVAHTARRQPRPPNRAPCICAAETNAAANKPATISSLRMIDRGGAGSVLQLLADNNRSSCVAIQPDPSDPSGDPDAWGERGWGRGVVGCSAWQRAGWSQGWRAPRGQPAAACWCTH